MRGEQLYKKKLTLFKTVPYNIFIKQIDSVNQKSLKSNFLMVELWKHIPSLWQQPEADAFKDLKTFSV